MVAVGNRFMTWMVLPELDSIPIIAMRLQAAKSCK